MRRAFLIGLLLAQAGVGSLAAPLPPPSLADETPILNDNPAALNGLKGQAPLIERRLVDGMGVLVMRLAYHLDRALTPHRPLSRPPDRIDPRPLREQAQAMLRDLREHFLIQDDRLYLYQLPMSMGDMAIWQGCYTAMAVLRYDRERDAVSRAYAEDAFDGLSLLYHRGLPLIRGILPAGFPNSNKGDSPYYHAAPGVQWMEDASIDQVSGWLLGLLVAEQGLPTRRAQAQRLLRAFTDGLIANRFHLKNSNGSDTRYGNMGKGALSPPTGVLLSFAALDASANISGLPRYRNDLKAFTRRHLDRWAAYPSAPALQWTHFYNHNIAFLALACALLAERDPARWDRFADGMVRLAEKVAAPEGNSFWLYLTYWAIQNDPAMLARNKKDRALARFEREKPRLLALALKSMLEFDFPRSKLALQTLNSRRKDLRFVHWPLTGYKTVRQPLPVWQRPPVEFVWQRDPYELDNWQGWTQRPVFRFNGMDFLLAYELGLSTGGIAPDQ